MAELSYSEDADLALRTLEADPSQSRLLQALYRTLDELAARPETGRRRRYTHDVWRIDVLDFILWFEDRDGEIVSDDPGRTSATARANRRRVQLYPSSS